MLKYLIFKVCILTSWLLQANVERDWTGSLPPTRPPTPSTRPHTPRTRPSTPSTRPHSPHSTHPHSPNSVQSSHDVKPFQQQQQQQLQQQQHQDIQHHQQQHYVVRGETPLPLARGYSSHSQPATRPGSPVSQSMPPSPQSNARTPPPKRWKRSFDLARTDDNAVASHAPADSYPQNGHVAAAAIQNGNGQEFGETVAKRFCEKRYSMETEREKRFTEADSNHGPAKRFVEPGHLMTTYPHSMPASPTMFDARYEFINIFQHKDLSHWRIFLREISQQTIYQ